MSKNLFWMASWRRKLLISSHQFYVDQAQRRLLSQFQNIEQEANAYAAEWLTKAANRFDPDRHCPGDYYEQANEEGVEFYEMLVDMLNRTRLGVLAGMFHEWEKKLRAWIVKEGKNWGCGTETAQAVWQRNFADIIKFLEACGWQIRSQSYFAYLDKYRLVINVFKHGDGQSFETLRKEYPELIGEDAEHTSLVVEQKHINELSQAIIEFWTDVPEHINDADSLDIPDWFCRAYERD